MSRKATAVPFTRPPEKEKTKSVSMNLPLRVYEYLTSDGRVMRDEVVRAVEFDRALGDELAPLDARIDAFAAANKLDRATDPAKVVAELIRRGLDAVEASPKGKR